MSQIPCFACQSPLVYDGHKLHCVSCGREWEAIVGGGTSPSLPVNGGGQKPPSRKRTPSRPGSSVQSQNRARGELSEEIARLQLQALGLVRIERIQVGWKVIRGDNGKITDAFPMAKVSGDYKAMTPNGTAVLVEVKDRSKRDRLRYSDLKTHQITALDEHVAYNGIGLVCWLPPSGDVIVMQWPIPGFIRRKSISIEHGKKHQWLGV